ncbi:hypothetical protein T440DRAFT_533789 [Plenodomus tracheiphilus IPT5]|uniref:Gfd2/YDR514C-like C-terminal domain-containing protein n=1 Tax=Plenodomus tracheiphilus IPT5 TaxID=1408161 RepID=A0A6A7B238_9PLEO|nr:hypothetical protein T440DRAFT_533789 [Plenodomus tracheiphilus IPT5]
MATQSTKKMNNLRKLLSSKPDIDILRMFVNGSNNLFDGAVLVTVHRVWSIHPPYDLTELGITTYDGNQGGRDYLVSPGPHAESIFDRVWSLHFRIRRQTHLPTATGEASIFHFGTTVFVTKEEVLDLLQQIWHQPSAEADGMRPVIYMHFGSNDGIGKMRKAQFDFDPTRFPTTIAVLDAQNIPAQAKITRHNDAPLRYLLPQFKIKPYNEDNAGNAAMYTTVVAILSSLRQELYASPETPRAVAGQKGMSISKSATSVIQWLMERPTPPPPFGITVYCWRCGSTIHEFSECPNNDLSCGKCEKSPLDCRKANAGSHIDGLCTFR